MNKKLTAFALTAVTMITAAGMTAAADEQIKVIVNGTPVIFEEAAPFIENERTLVPMRAIFEALGASVNWDDEHKTVTAYDPVSDVSITMQIDQAEMFVGEKRVELDAPARIVNDRTVVPVRAIAEGMNSVVGWDDATRTVTVEKDMEKPAYTAVQTANPWSEYKTLEELNAAINEKGAFKYTVSDPSAPVEVKENGYRYLEGENMAEMLAVWAVGEGADVVIRTMPGDMDISGIYGGEKAEEYILDNSLVEIYRYENTLYAIWSCEDITVYSHSAAITSDWDATEILKTIVEDIETHHPRG